MKIKGTLKSLFMVFVVCLVTNTYAVGQEMPKPGTTIDQSNYKQYAHLFPPEVLPAFEDGFGGIMEPASIKVDETPPSYGILPLYKKLSMKNKGKFGIDENGMITGGWEEVCQGLPFPDLQEGDKDFATKLMWNYTSRYRGDDTEMKQYAYTQRKGEPVRWMVNTLRFLSYNNRIKVDPVPWLDNPIDAINTMVLFYKAPVSMKNMFMITMRYRDQARSDELYLYVPNMRRIVRGDSGQRSAPIQGSIFSPDDTMLFDGKCSEFNFTLVGKQTILAAQNVGTKPIPKGKLKNIPFSYDNLFSPLDVYVVDIVSKNPVYPQSKKRLYLSQDQHHIAQYAICWDRAGKLWKVYYMGLIRQEMPGEGDYPIEGEMFGIDVQTGTVVTNIRTNRGNLGGASFDDFNPSSMIKNAR